MFDVILLIAGKGKRTKLDYNKTLYLINDKPIFKYSLDIFLKMKELNKVVLVIDKEDEDIVNEYIKDINSNKIEIVYGGLERQDSVKNGIDKCSSDVVLIHDGARAYIEEGQVQSVYDNARRYNASALAVKTTDTIRELKKGSSNIVDRNLLWNMQTPQGVNLQMFKEALKKAYEDNYYGTDDLNLLEKYFDIVPKLVEGSKKNLKFTTIDDLDYLKFILGEQKMEYRIGHSNDTHRLEAGRKLILGGVEIDYHLGLIGHSDADCIYHVVSEAIIGALGLGDIGSHFPDNDKKYKDQDSSYFVVEARKLMEKELYIINNLDLIVYAENVYLNPHINTIRDNIAKLLICDKSRINIKATRREKLGFVGREEGISAEAVVLLKKK